MNTHKVGLVFTFLMFFGECTPKIFAQNKVETVYYPNGQKKNEVTYKLGQKDGIEIW